MSNNDQMAAFAMSPDMAGAVVLALPDNQRRTARYIDGMLHVPAAYEADVQAAVAAPHTNQLKLRSQAARAACAMRILARASATTQINMAAFAALAGSKTNASRTQAERDFLTDFAIARDWIDAMRAQWLVIAAQALDPADDANWPACPPEAIALAARF